MALEKYGLSVELRAELDRFEQAMRGAGRLVSSTTSDIDKTTRRAAEAMGRLEGRVTPLGRALNALDKDMRIVQTALDKGVRTEEQAAAMMARLNNMYDERVRKITEAVGAQNQLATSNTRLATTTTNYNQEAFAAYGATKDLGAISQQAGYQIGDFAVQVASGQNAIVAFTQQMTQVLGVFGTWGSIAGAVLAITGAVAVSFLDLGNNASVAERASEALKKAQEGLPDRLSDTADSVGDLKKKYDELSTSMRAVERLTILGDQREARNQLRELREAIDDELDSIQSKSAAFRAVQNLAQNGVGTGIEQQGLATPEGRQMSEVTAALDRFQAGGTAAALVEDLERLAAAGTKVSEELMDTAVAAATAAKDEEELRLEMARLDAEMALLNGTATEQQKALLNVALADEDSTDKKKKAKTAADEFREALFEVNKELDEYNKKAKETAEGMELEIEALQLQLEGREKEAEWLKEEMELRDELGPYYDQNAEQLKTLWERRRELNEELEKSKEAERKAAEALKKFNEDVRKVSDDISGDLAESIWDGITGEGKQQSILDWFKNLFKRIALEALKANVILPITSQVVGAMPGLFGISSPQGAAGAGGLTSNLSSVSNLFGSGNYSMMPGLDSWAQSTFGWGQIGLTSVGAAGVGSIGGGAAANLGVAAVPGGITNASASAPGLFNGGSGTAGFGSLGNVLGIAGSILPGLMSGNYVQAGLGGAGAALGTVILPGIGTAIGGMIGNIVGGLFKGSTPAGNNVVGIYGDGGRKIDVGEQGNTAGPLIEMANRTIDMLNGFGEQFGGNLRNDKLGQFGYTEKYNEWYFSGQKMESPEKAVEAAINAILTNPEAWEGISEDVAQVMRASVGKSADEALANINFASNYRTLFDAAEDAMGPYESSLHQLNLTFVEATRKAQELGLQGIGQMTDSFEKAKIRLAEDFNRNIADRLLAEINPAVLALLNLNREFEVLRKEALAIGGSVEDVERLYALLRRRTEMETETRDVITPIVNRVNEARNALAAAYQNERGELEQTISTMEGLFKSLRDTRMGLKVDSAFTPLNPVDQLAEMQSQFRSVAARAQAGDEDAMAQLPEISRQYLEIARGFHASNEDYAEIFNEVQAALAATEGVAERQLQVAQAQLNSINAIATSMALVNEQLDTLAEALDKYGDVVQNPNRIWAGPGREQNIPVNMAVAAATGYTGDFGSGGFTAYILANPHLAAVANAVFDQYNFQGGRFAVPGMGGTPGAQVPNNNNDRVWSAPGYEHNIPLNQQLAALTGYTGDWGSGGFSAFMQGPGAHMKAQVNALLQANGRGAGYANGGFATPGFAIVGENTDAMELVNFKSPARVYSNREMFAAMSDGSGAIVAELRASNKALAESNAVLRAGFRALINTTEGSREGLDKLVRRIDPTNRVKL